MRTVLIIFLFSMVSIVQAQSVEQEISSLESQLKALEGVIDRIPYGQEQHTTIESYFKKLNLLALNIKDYSNTSRGFNNYVSRYGADNFCRRSFLDSKRWSDLVANCTRNGFFLCAEEVRGFSAMKKSLKESLRDDLRKSFDASKLCNIP